MITLLGLGPGNADLLTREAWNILHTSTTVYLRTRRHPTIAGLPSHLVLHDFDHLYDESDNFGEVYARIADTIITVAQSTQDDIIYAVPGHPLIGEATSARILNRAQELNIPTRIVSGLSFIEPILEGLSSELTQNSKLKTQNFDALNGLQICDALEIATLHHPPLNPDKPALIAQVYSRGVASDVKLTLMNQYPPEHEVTIVRGSGGAGEQGSVQLAPPHLVTSAPLHQLDHADHFDHLTSLYVPALPYIGGFEAFQETIAHLRAPEGCPWDREQTHESLRNTLLEEAYEVLTAIDEGDLVALKEELGDLLLNVMLQAQIATEAEEFRMSDVIAEIDAKLKRRHPHVFGDPSSFVLPSIPRDQAQDRSGGSRQVVNVRDSNEVITNWNEIKKQEKAAKGEQNGSALDGIAPALPALAQAQKMAHRAEKAGFKWNNHNDRLAKVREELNEVVSARDNIHRAEEIGDLLFTIADWADGYGIDAETAAREANLKFARRFRALERAIRERGLNMNTMSQADMLRIWREIKERET